MPPVVNIWSIMSKGLAEQFDHDIHMVDEADAEDR